jgi:uncharacterized membrane protein
MKRWHYIAVGLSVAIITVSLIGFLLPNSYRVERAISIKAPTETVYATISNLNTWPDWSPWQKGDDTTLSFNFTGEIGTVGSNLSWQGDKVGAADITLTKTNPLHGVAYTLSTDGMPLAEGKIRFLDKGTERTRVAFEYSATLGWNPVLRFAGLFAEGKIGPEFETALLRLKTQLETQP